LLELKLLVSVVVCLPITHELSILRRHRPSAAPPRRQAPVLRPAVFSLL